MALNDGWAFAIINGRLGEIYFKKNYGIWAHCYINSKEFSKVEQHMINVDTKRNIFSYRDNIYFDKLTGIKFRHVSKNRIFGSASRKYIRNNVS